MWISITYQGPILSVLGLIPATGKKEASFMINKKSVQRVSPTYGEDWVLIVQGK